MPLPWQHAVRSNSDLIEIWPRPDPLNFESLGVSLLIIASLAIVDWNWHGFNLAWLKAYEKKTYSGKRTHDTSRSSKLAIPSTGSFRDVESHVQDVCYALPLCLTTCHTVAVWFLQLLEATLPTRCVSESAVSSRWDVFSLEEPSSEMCLVSFKFTMRHSAIGSLVSLRWIERR